MFRSLKLGLLFSLVLLLFCTGMVEASLQHNVQYGDTVWKIAQRYGSSVAAISKASNLANADLIYPGQKLIIPGKHLVQPGESLWLIAQKHGTSVAALAQANNIKNVSLIYSGQILTIPGASSIPSTPATGSGISQADLDLFARLVHAEAASEPYVGQVAVAASVLNRVKDPRYPNTIRAVILQVVNGCYQYSPVLDGRINLPAGQTAYAAVRDALNGWDPSLGATGFYNPRKTSNQWVRQQPVTTVIGNHVFFR